MTIPAHRPDRLRRAWSLVKAGLVVRESETQFRVAGNCQPEYVVDLAHEPPCSCEDKWFHEAAHQCKHELAARMANQELPVLMSLIETMKFKEEED